MSGLKVRGTCKAGHVVDAVAPKGRVTWRGKCTTDGCENVVTARRIKDAGASPPASPPAGVEGSPAGRASKREPRKVVKVSGYQRRPAHGADPDVPAAPGPAGSPAGGNPGKPDDDQQRDGDAGDRAARKPRRRPLRAAEPQTGDKRHPYSHLGFNW